LQKMLQLDVNKDVNLTAFERQTIEGKHQDAKARDFAVARAQEKKRLKFIAKEARSQNDMCITDFMVKFVQAVRKMTPFGKTLDADSDKKNYFGAKITELLREYQTAVLFTGLINNLFYNFMKSLAQQIGLHIWENHVSINKEFFSGLLMQFGMEREVLDTLVDSIREKTKSVKKTTTAKANDDAAKANDGKQEEKTKTVDKPAEDDAVLKDILA